jgi:malate dehydrogenase
MMPHRVAVVGTGTVGSALAHRLAEQNLAHVVLFDIVPGRPQGVALDISQAITHLDRPLHGTNDLTDTANSDVIVLTAGLPRKAGMSRDDLLYANAEIVASLVPRLVHHSPAAILVVVINPLDVMTHWVWRLSKLPPERVVGMAGILDAARFRLFIATALGCSNADIRALVLGGHGDLMVPLPSYTTVHGIPVTELIPRDRLEELIARTRNGGAEIVQLLQTSSAGWAPAAATSTMVAAILGDRQQVLPVSTQPQGAYGLHDLHVGLPVLLGRQGVSRVVTLPLTDGEREQLSQSAAAIHTQCQLLRL